MFDENNNGTQNQEEMSDTGKPDLEPEVEVEIVSEKQDTSEEKANDTTTDTSSEPQENHEYRYGRSYYQNQQDSVYHTNEGSYQNQSNQSTYSGQNTYSGQGYSASQNGNTTQGSYSNNGMNRNNYGQSQYQTYTTGNYTQNSGNNRKTADGRKKSAGKIVMKVLKVAACVVLVAAVGAGSAFGTVKLMEKDNHTSKTVQTTVAGTKDTTSDYKVSTVSASTAVVTDVSDVVEKTMPSVVKITNIGTQTYEGFFGQSQTYESESNGSGIIIGQTEDELLVVTNQHVVSGADKLKVIFIDEEACEANVKGTDAEKDLAVIAVPMDSIKEETLEQIKVATLGDSDAVNVGEPAIAIGNALGYGQSVTLGVISAKEREVTTENGTNTLIQTDAAINPGNSGGALMNIAGEVIGINSVKYSSTEVEGMGYAIPISDATPIINELMNKETKTKVDKDQQAYLGISGVDITSDVAQAYNMPKGVYIAQVVKDSPAEEAGLKKGDIITKIADVSVTSFDELKAEIEYHAAGTTVQIEVLTQAKDSYGYETKTVDVTLAKKED